MKNGGSLAVRSESRHRATNPLRTGLLQCPQAPQTSLWRTTRGLSDTLPGPNRRSRPSCADLALGRIGNAGIGPTLRGSLPRQTVDRPSSDSPARFDDPGNCEESGGARRWNARNEGACRRIEGWLELRASASRRGNPPVARRGFPPSQPTRSHPALARHNGRRPRPVLRPERPTPVLGRPGRVGNGKGQSRRGHPPSVCRLSRPHPFVPLASRLPSRESPAAGRSVPYRPYWPGRGRLDTSRRLP